MFFKGILSLISKIMGRVFSVVQQYVNYCIMQLKKVLGLLNDIFVGPVERFHRWQNTSSSVLMCCNSKCSPNVAAGEQGIPWNSISGASPSIHGNTELDTTHCLLWAFVFCLYCDASRLPPTNIDRKWRNHIKIIADFEIFP